jgi:hypothetical protein
LGRECTTLREALKRRKHEREEIKIQFYFERKLFLCVLEIQGGGQAESEIKS